MQITDLRIDPLKLKTWRHDRGLTQQSVAAAAGMSLASIQNIESGRSGGSLESLLKLAAALGVDKEAISRDAEVA